ncbi:MAG: acyl-CoA dehydrogenase, partial [Shewanella sp.]
MTTLLWIIAMILVLGALAYLRVSLLTATIAAAVVMAGGWMLDVIGPISWIVFLVIALPFNIKPVRQHLISRPLMKVYRGIMPEMSSTEKEAIEAGTTWWEADLFAGNPNWKKLHNYPVARLSADEQA